VLKLTVASYYRPSGENIHRFKNAKTTDQWGVSPDKGCEVKLTPSEYVRWYRGRRDRDLAAGHRRAPAEKPAADQAKSDTKPAAAKGQEKAEAKKEPEKAEPKRPSVRRSTGPFVDKQLDKALEVIRSKLAATAKAA
jgi:carboxyl-terminal processing protease